jgi:hypothetical protein
MSDYSVTYDGAALDAANATITGAALDTEFDNIATMSATKANKVGSPTTGNLLKQSSTGDLVDAAIAYDDVVTLSGTSQTVTGSFADLGTVTTVDINGGTIDGTAIGASSASTGVFTSVGMTGTLTLSKAASGPVMNFSGPADADTLDMWRITPSDYGTGKYYLSLRKLGAASYELYTYDGTDYGGTLRISAGVHPNVTFDSSGATFPTVDINGGAIDGTTVGASSASTGAFTTLSASGGGSLTGTWTDLGTVTTVDINGGTVDGVTIGGASAGAGTFTSLSSPDLPVYKVKTANESITSSTTLQNDDDLNGFALTAGKRYHLKAHIIVENTGGGASDWKWQLTHSNAWQHNSFLVHYQNYDGGNATSVSALDSGYYDGAISASFAAGAIMIVTIDGVFQANATTGGTVDFQWAKYSDTTYTINVNADSYIAVTQLD